MEGMDVGDSTRPNCSEGSGKRLIARLDCSCLERHYTRDCPEQLAQNGFQLLLRFDNIAFEIHVSKMNSEISKKFSQPTTTTLDDFYL